MEKVGEDSMPIDNDVREILDEHRERLCYLEQQHAVTQERLKNIEVGQQDLKNTVLTSNNSILQSMHTMTQTVQSLAINQNDNKTKLEAQKGNNTFDVIRQILVIIGSLLAGLKIVDFLG